MKKPKAANGGSALSLETEQLQVELQPLMGRQDSQASDTLDSPASAYRIAAASPSAAAASAATAGPALSTSPSLAPSLSPSPSAPLPRLMHPRQHQPLLTPSLVLSLLPHLPSTVSIRPSWTLLYCTSIHGHSLSTLYHQLSLNADADGPNLLLCRDSDGFVFGCWTPVSWCARELYYGNSESFVFTALPVFRCYEAVEERRRRESRQRRQHRDELQQREREAQQLQQQAAAVEVVNAQQQREAEEEEEAEAAAEREAEREGGRYYMLAKSDQLAIGSGRRFALWLDSAFRDGSSGPCATFDSPMLSKKPQFKCFELECWGF